MSYDRNALVHLHWNWLVLFLPLVASDCSVVVVDGLQQHQASQHQ